MPGLDVDSAQQIIAEVGGTAATFPFEKHLSSWVGAFPGEEESAEVNHSRRSPQGNRHMRRILNQAANAAAKHKRSIFQILYGRYVPRLGHNQTIGIMPTNFAAWSGRYCTGESATKNEAQRSAKPPSKSVPEK